MKTYKLDNDVTLTEEQMKDIAEAYNKPEFKYPIFKKNTINGHIVKFSTIKMGEIVWKGSSLHDIGQSTIFWAPHTDTKVWEDVPYDRDRDLWNGQPVLCWDDNDSHQRIIKFYNAIKKCTFTWKGTLNGDTCENYEAIPSDRYDKWIIEGYNTLEGIEDEKYSNSRK